MLEFLKRREPKQVKLPELLNPENPVNYNSVLEYLIGLSPKEYEKINKISVIYRDANKQAAKLLGVKDEPTTALKADTQTDDEIESDLDQLLETDPADLKAAMENAPEIPKAQKPQAPAADKKIEVKQPS